MTAVATVQTTRTRRSGGSAASLRAEWRKLTSLRWWWAVGIGAVLLGAGAALLTAVVALRINAGAPLSQGQVLAVVSGGNPFARLLALVVGVVAVGSEYRHRTIVDTYLAVPRRGRVVTAKLAALGVVGFGYGLLHQAAGLVVALVVLPTGSDLFLTQPSVWRSIGMGAVSIAWWAWIGIGIGLLVRGVGAALLLGLGVAYLVEPSLAALCLFLDWNTALNLLPTGATNAMLGAVSPLMLSGAHPWAWWAGALVLLTWTLLAVGIGSLVSLRREV